MDRIILASQSLRRKQLLEWAEIDFEVIVSATDESYPAEMNIEEVPVHIARNKAIAVMKNANGGQTILAADTIVVLDGMVIGKPKDKSDALRILSKLSGKKHLVITGVVIMNGKKEVAFADTTEVWFHNLTDEQLEFYVNKYQPYDKAGAYAIQEWIGVVGIKSISGDFYTVMGLPVRRLIREFEPLQK